MIHIGVTDEDGNTIVCRVSGGYNPDIAEDLTNRAGELYYEILSTRQQILVEEVDGVRTDTPADPD